MRKYIALMTVIALAGLLGGGRILGSAQGKTDKDKLQGAWTVTSLMFGGQSAPEEFLKGSVLTFKGDMVAVKMGPKPEEEGSYTIDATKNPKTITLIPPKGKEKEKVLRAIYTFEGDDTLKICGSDEAELPKEFASKEGTKFVLITMKRAKK